MARMTSTRYRQDFLASEEAAEVTAKLLLMESSPEYYTTCHYSPASVESITFTNKHIAYLSDHPGVKPLEYLSNLRLKTRVRK